MPIANDTVGKSALLIRDRRKEKIYFSTSKVKKYMAKGQCHKNKHRIGEKMMEMECGPRNE